MAAKKPNWNAIKAQYIAGETAPDLARKFGVKVATLKSKASREKWGDDRNEVATNLQLEMPGKVLAIALDEAGEWVRETLASAKMLKRKFDESIYADRKHVASTKEGPILIDIPLLNTAQDLKALADSLASIDKTARQALGLDKAANEEANNAKTEPYGEIPEDSDKWKGLIGGKHVET